MPRNHDDDRSFRSPRAWQRLKRELDRMGNGLPELARMLEETADTGSVRLCLAFAIHAYVTMSQSGREAALKRYFDWIGHLYQPAPAAESLPESERVTAAEMKAVEWALLAPGFPFPPNLPDDVEFRPMLTPGKPPMIWSEAKGWGTIHCPVCGKPYIDSAAFRRHRAKHEAAENAPANGGGADDAV
jgi:hypothetical protein